MPSVHPQQVWIPVNLVPCFVLFAKVLEGLIKGFALPRQISPQIGKETTVLLDPVEGKAESVPQGLVDFTRLEVSVVPIKNVVALGVDFLELHTS
jgi:hypothetical protein